MVNIEDIKSRIAQGVALGAPFNLKGSVPLSKRDELETLEELEAIRDEDNIYPRGYRVYCKEDTNLYIFRGNDGKTHDRGQFDLIGFVSPNDKTKVFEFKGQVANFGDITSPEVGDIWRVSGDSENTVTVVIPSGNSASNTAVSASTGDMLVCIGNTNNTSTWSVLQNNIDDENIVQKSEGNYSAGQVAIFANNKGNRLSGSTLLADKIVQLETNPQYTNVNGTQLYNLSGTTKSVPIVNSDGKLEDSMVDVKILQDLQKELGGTAIAELPQNPVAGTLADMMQKYRDNNYNLGSNFAPISATTESDFKEDIQGIISASTNNVGFVIPVVIMKSDDPENEKFIFEDFIPDGDDIANVEARIRKDGAEGDDIRFHVDFEIEKHNLQYWYKGNGESVLYHEDYGFSEDENV
jgi:hypothetical protein